jgi:membrane protease YdiL (CAAX protease family)
MLYALPNKRSMQPFLNALRTLSFTLLTALAFPAHAEDAIPNPLSNTGTLEGLLEAFLQAIVQIGAVFLVLALVYVGFKFTQAQGKEEKIKEARHALFWIVIGGLILLGAEFIAQIVAATAEQL